MSDAPVQETILIVDDEPALIRLVSRVLERKGYATLVASDGDEAIAEFEKHKDTIDGVILDVVIPSGGGGAVLAHLAAARPDLMVILSSGDEPNDEMSARIEEYGGVFLRKPYLPKALIKLVESELAARRESAGAEDHVRASS